jgi:hypothetical protein
MRTANGMSLIEMLSAIFIMSFVAAAMCEVALVQNSVAFRVYGKIEGLTSARRLAPTIEREVHMARFIGDQFGSGLINGPNTFPSAGNPEYSQSSSSVAGFQGYPSTTSNTSWPLRPYTLDQQTLIIQVPIFTTDGFPTKSSIAGKWNVDTIVYKVLADQSKPGLGQFVLQKAIFAGEHLAGYQPAPGIPSNQPETIVTGIVGPIDPSGTPDPTAGVPTPKVFSYFNKLYPAYQTTFQQYPLPGAVPPGVVNAADIPNINGVATNMEITGTAAARKDLTAKTVAFRTETYVRSNFTSTP